MRLVWLKSIALGAAFALSFGVLAEESERPQFILHDASAELLQGGTRAVSDEELETLRGRLAIPVVQAGMGVQQAGVVLWDEPGKGEPAALRSSRSAVPAGVTATVNTLR